MGESWYVMMSELPPPLSFSPQRAARSRPQGHLPSPEWCRRSRVSVSNAWEDARAPRRLRDAPMCPISTPTSNLYPPSLHLGTPPTVRPQNPRRNTALKSVRATLRSSRIFFGRNKLIATALGRTPSDEYADALHEVASSLLGGEAGLLFTDEPLEAVRKCFAEVFVSDVCPHHPHMADPPCSYVCHMCVICVSYVCHPFFSLAPFFL